MSEETAERDDSLREVVESYLRAAGRNIVEFTAEEELPDTFEDAVEVADEAEDVAAHLDVSDIVDAIDWSELPDVMGAESMQEAIDSGDAGDAIHVRELIEAIDFGELADSVDVRQAWKEGRELDDAVDDVTDDDAVDDVTNDDASAEETADEKTDEEASVDVDTGAFDDADPEAIRMGVQSEMMDAVDEFRAGLLEVHEELETIIEENREASRQRRAEQPKSRNPTAVSTMPGGGPLGSKVRQGSTVPRETRYSKAPNRERLYGKRLEEGTDD